MAINVAQETVESVGAKLKKLEDDLKCPQIYFQKPDPKEGTKYYLHKSWEQKFAELGDKCLVLCKHPDNIDLYTRLNKFLCWMLKGIIVGNNRDTEEKQVSDGQRTSNATSSEINVSYTHPEFGYCTDEFDHEYIKTGRGIGEPDFKMLSEFKTKARVVDPLSGLAVDSVGGTLTLHPGDTVDMKDYWSLSSAKAALNENYDGKLGHYGNMLLLHIMSTNKFYCTRNVRDAKVYELPEFRPLGYCQQYRYTLDADGLLRISKYNTYEIRPN
jgi:hypothetical protein